MKVVLVTLLLVLAALTTIPVATADPGNDKSLFGRCTAWNANEKGRENGNAENAPPFQDLQDRAEEAEESVEDYCSDVPHPSENGKGHDEDGRGPPE